ncbi:tetratricopeptide repeat protein [Flavisolibacter nicotianae]|uniref:tetratricopeptide repeat protein n=1 Tax=Flavisolibacter nicotianae TaxID=2364882 RepID=UPI000EAF3075|nr:tetratricopeptide repeat protein [Flavisolibacter nicotianae]
MKKSAILLFFAALFSLHAMAQSVQEGIAHLNAERYQSARQVFEKLTASNPNNLEAVYWLGQTLLAQDDVNGARALYQKTLAANGNAPWIMVGMGQINLLDGKAAEARQLFDAALAASKGKKGSDVAILTAVARANIQAYSDQKKQGDLDYAIAKLNEAAQQAPTNPDIFVALGNAYRKKHQGGDAVQAYRKAGNYAPALYRIASLYQSQRNWDAVTENLNSAVAADPKFAPAFFDLYYYNLLYKKDFASAASFAEKFKAVADPTVENEYLTAQTAFVQNNFTAAIASASKIVSGSQNPRPRVYRLLAYSYLGAKDTASACTNSNLYLQKAPEEDIIGADYILHATACGRGNPALIRDDIAAAIKKDSVLSRQLETLNDAIENAKANNNKLLEGELRLISYQLRQGQGRASNDELISYIAVPLYLGGNYQKADSVAQAYSAAVPDSIHGYYWSALSRTAIDTNMQQGLAIPMWEKVLTVAEGNKERFKSQGVRAATSLAVYNTNIKQDRDAALGYVTRGLAFDPANDNLLNIQKVLSQSGKTPRAADSKTKTKTEAAGGKVKSKSKG